MKTIYIYFKRNYHLILLLAIILLGSVKYSAAQTKHIIEVSNTVFTPDDLEIEVGDTVEWQNIQGFHNVNGTQSEYPDNPEFFGNSTGTGWTYSYVFNTVGKYDYHCNPHVDLGMTGEIRVNESVDNQENHLVINFSGMDPHNNQMLYLRVYEKNSGKEIERTIEDISPSFTDSISGIKKGKSYYIDFFADHNSNGKYDAPGTDHAWRLELNDVMGDTTLNFAHNTNFTDIMWQNRLTVHFTGMTPHVGQDLWLAVVDKNSGMEVDRVHTVVEEEFMVHAYGIKSGMSYNVDFFADFNENGMYDAPGTDHAWRMDLDNVTGDTTLNFAHNTNFTDIMWKHQLTLQFIGMTPHVGQMLKLYVVNSADGLIKDSVTVEEISDAAFEVNSNSLMGGESYHINFFADFNQNGRYDIPPTDHAWQIILEEVTGDTTLLFAHNTDFTDIFNLTSIDNNELGQFRIYPNPASKNIWIDSGEAFHPDLEISIYDIMGRLHNVEVNNLNNRIKLNISNLNDGIYLVELKNADKRKLLKLIKR